MPVRTPSVSGRGYPWAKVITRALTPWAASASFIVLTDKVNFIVHIIHKVHALKDVCNEVDVMMLLVELTNNWVPFIKDVCNKDPEQPLQGHTARRFIIRILDQFY